MAWTVLFYEKSGKRPVQEFLESLPPKAKAKCVSYIKLFREKGFALPRNYLEKVEDNLWALRPEFGNVEYRLFICKTEKNTVVLIHAAKKNQRRLASCGLETAQQRRDELSQK